MPPYGLADIAPMTIDATPDFRTRYAAVLHHLLNDHPDPRVPQLLAAVPIRLRRMPRIEDFQAAGIMAPTGNELLTGLHYGDRESAYGSHLIILFEQPIEIVADMRGLSVEEQIESTTLHELEHVLGFCAPSHTDCSDEQIAMTQAEEQATAYLYETGVRHEW